MNSIEKVPIKTGEKKKNVNKSGSELIKKTLIMYLRKSIKVPQWNRNCLYAIIILTSHFLIGQTYGSDSNSYNSENYANNHRKIPSSGSGGGGTLEKRSSYAVISQAMSETINNEFGSEYTMGDDLIGSVYNRRHVRALFRYMKSNKNIQITGGAERFNMTLGLIARHRR